MPGEFLPNDDSDASEPRRTRLKLETVSFERSPSGRCSAKVELRWEDGSKLLGMAEGHASALGELRLAADAAVRAVRAFLPLSIKLDVLGVKPLRVFDANIVIVAVGVTVEGSPQIRLLGSDLSETDPIKAAAKAVLSATNRLVYTTVVSSV